LNETTADVSFKTTLDSVSLTFCAFAEKRHTKQTASKGKILVRIAISSYFTMIYVRFSLIVLVDAASFEKSCLKAKTKVISRFEV
jgi:hypothetical protein